jgi:hypothetical protein
MRSLIAAVEAVLPGGLDGLDAQQVSDALAHVTFLMGEATELFQNPDRPPGWVLRDPAVLQALGQASRQNVRSIVTLANDRPRLAASLAGRFLDVGTGVGAVALEAAERYIAPLFAPMQRAISAAVAGYGENELAILIDFFTRHHKEAVAATAELQTVRPGRGSETAAGPAKAATQFDKAHPLDGHIAAPGSAARDRDDNAIGNRVRIAACGRRLRCK